VDPVLSQVSPWLPLASVSDNDLSVYGVEAVGLLPPVHLAGSSRTSLVQMSTPTEPPVPPVVLAEVLIAADDVGGVPGCRSAPPNLLAGLGRGLAAGIVS